MGPAEYARILDHYSNPDLKDTPAEKLNRLLGDGEASRHLVCDWIESNVVRMTRAGYTMTPMLLVRVCRRVSIEALIHKHYGVSVRQIRAGSRYERALAGRRLPRADRERVWDEAVRADLARQIAKGNANLVHLPLHDGSTLRPGSRPNARHGLDAWERMFDRRGPVSMPAWAEETFSSDRTVASGTPGGGFRVTAAWLAEHGVDERTLARLDAADLRDMGVEPDMLRRAARERFAGTPKARALARVLDDRTLALELSARTPGLTAVRALARLGVDEAWARTAVAMTRMGDDAAAWDRARMKAGTERLPSGGAGLLECRRRIRTARERGIAAFDMHVDETEAIA